jgi:hypothetical protein
VTLRPFYFTAVGSAVLFYDLKPSGAYAITTTHPPTRTHARTHARAHTHTHTNEHTHTHTHTHTQTHTHAHIHTHLVFLSFLVCS